MTPQINSTVFIYKALRRQYCFSPFSHSTKELLIYTSGSRSSFSSHNPRFDIYSQSECACVRPTMTLTTNQLVSKRYKYRVRLSIFTSTKFERQLQNLS